MQIKRGSLIIARVGLDVRKYVINRGGDDMRLRLYYFYGHFGKPATDCKFLETFGDLGFPSSNSRILWERMDILDYIH